MLKIAKLNRYRNGEAVTFASNVLDILKARNLTYLSTAQADLERAYDNLSAAYKKEAGNIMSDDLKALDKLRDNAIKGIILALRSFEYHYEATKRRAADVLLRNIQKYSDNVATLGYKEETAALKAIATEWETDSELSEAVTLLGLTEWRVELDSANRKFDETYVNRFQIDAQKSLQNAVSELRKPLETAYKAVTTHIMANFVLNPSQNLTETIAELNMVIDKYNLDLRRR